MVEVTQEDREAVRAFHAKALGLAISGNEANRLLTEAFARHRIAAENAAQQEIAALDAARGKAEPVAVDPQLETIIHSSMSRDFERRYAHPPADRVARVVEFIREQQANAHRHMLEAAHRKTASLFAAAFVTLRNLVDAIERGEPFNG